MKQLLDDLTFYEAEVKSAIEYDNMRGYSLFKSKIKNLKEQIKIMTELDAKLSFNFNVLVDNLGIEVTDYMMKPITEVAIKLAKDYAAHCMQEQKILCVNNAELSYGEDEGQSIEIDRNSILNTLLYNGENYGQ